MLGLIAVSFACFGFGIVATSRKEMTSSDHVHMKQISQVVVRALEIKCLAVGVDSLRFVLASFGVGFMI